MPSTEGLFFFLVSTLLRTRVSHWRPLSDSTSPLTPAEVLCGRDEIRICDMMHFYFILSILKLIHHACYGCEK